MYLTHLLSRIIRYEVDLVDRLFNSSEKRLARLLLLLSHFGRESGTETVVPGINQEQLVTNGLHNPVEGQSFQDFGERLLNLEIVTWAGGGNLLSRAYSAARYSLYVCRGGETYFEVR